MKRRTDLAVLLLLGACAMPLRSADELRPGTHEAGFWAGYSPSNPTLIGTVTGRQLGMLALRYGYYFGRSGPVTFEYTADLLPVAVVRQPDVYGFAFAPAGFKFNFGRARVSPFLGVTAGMIYTTEPVPVTGPETTRWNFMFDFGGGLQWVVRDRGALMFGYKLHHISNANRTNVNPGLDSNVIYAGYSRLLRK